MIFMASIVVAEDKSTKKANKLLDKVRKDLTALSADFVQYEIDANERQSDKSTGKVWLNAPNQFKWQYQKPTEQLIIASGKQVWIYDKDLEQVTIKQQHNNQNPIYVLLNREQTDKYYTVSLVKQDKKSKDKLQWIRMLPKSSSDEVKNVWLGIKGKNLSVLKLQNQFDNIVIFEFNNIQRNPKLADDFFIFKIPQGIDVIRDTANIGEF